MGGGDGGGGGWGGVRVRCRGDYKVRHQLNLCLRALTWEMKKGGGCFFHFRVLLPF